MQDNRLRDIIELYAEGRRQDFIARSLGISQPAVSKCLTSAGLSQSIVLQRLRKGESVDSILSASSQQLPFDEYTRGFEAGKLEGWKAAQDTMRRFLDVMQSKTDDAIADDSASHSHPATRPAPSQQDSA